MNTVRILSDKNIAIVTAYDDINPINHLSRISSDLSHKQFRGMVLFDLFFFNGFSFNRFASINFDGNKFIKKTIQVFAHVDPELEAQQNDLLLKNREIVSQSVLSKREIENFYNF
ncbi:type II toxin-antitoxin system RnlB family antitoxin [Acinetobacter sp. yr461]|uniref:type II toxin-antitoxin system RnlB family antitoxin n=1 Tax=Acinetobacter sp. yr461 TaxID=1761742 RepID=UPI0008C3B0C0|nr:type II toxin-antitoxin system RnlB family antitoxin [Acinetobacter sp. yr461]SEO66239.1 Antitoxin to toxin RNase LS or RnlA [Acinetobacter sp. yr461]